MNDGLQKERIRILRQRTDRLEHEGDYWTKDEIRMLVDGFNNCAGITEMADHLQRTEPAVMQQIEKMDLYHRKDNPKRRRKKKQARCLCDRCRIDAAHCQNRAAAGEEEEED